LALLDESPETIRKKNSEDSARYTCSKIKSNPAVDFASAGPDWLNLLGIFSAFSAVNCSKRERREIRSHFTVVALRTGDLKKQVAEMVVPRI